MIVSRLDVARSFHLALACLVVVVWPFEAGSQVVVEGAHVAREMTAGSVVATQVTLRNTGSEPWVAGGLVRLAYHWHTPDGDVVVFDGRRTQFTRRVMPGDTTTLCASIEAPEAPGTYVLTWSLVHEGVAWIQPAPESPAATHTVVVGPASTPTEHARTAIPVFVALGLFVLHFVISAMLVRRWMPEADDDHRLNATIVIWLGTWLGALQVVASTAGLSWPAAVVAVVVTQAAIAAMAFSRPDAPARPAPGGVDDHVERVAAAVAGAALVGIGLRWVAAASASMDAVGTDAAHYHVPHAINLALGAPIFGLPATPHLYPMATSVLGAWFILPVGDPLLVDLAMVGPFLLLVAAVAWLLRLLTGTRGFVWAVAIVLLLFATPLFRLSAHMSSDLTYAAGLLAVAAQLVGMAGGRARSGLDWIVLGLAIGLLCGAKTTGLLSAALMLVCAGGWLVVARLAGARVVRPAMSPAALAATPFAFLAAGGVWALRNWVTYGSPAAPATFDLTGLQTMAGSAADGGRYYLSVLGDMRQEGGYALVERTTYWVRQWLGPWYLPGLGLVGVVAIDAAVACRLARTRTVATTRLVVVGLVLALTALHAMLIAGAPWSSLEWTEGLALRYILPWLVFGPVIAALVAQPLSIRRGMTADGILAAVALGVALVVFAGHQATAGIEAEQAVPTLTIEACTVGLVIVLLSRAAFEFRHRSRAMAVATSVVAGGVPTVVLWMLASGTASTHAPLRERVVADLARLESCAALDDAARDRYERAHLDIVAWERAEDIDCRARRIFVGSRFDWPLTLQRPPSGTIIFNAQASTFAPRLIEAAGPGRGACDYLVARRAEIETLRGVPLVSYVGASRLRPITPEGRHFEVYRIVE